MAPFGTTSLPDDRTVREKTRLSGSGGLVNRALEWLLRINVEPVGAPLFRPETTWSICILPVELTPAGDRNQRLTLTLRRCSPEPAPIERTNWLRVVATVEANPNDQAVHKCACAALQKDLFTSAEAYLG